MKNKKKVFLALLFSLIMICCIGCGKKDKETINKAEIEDKVTKLADYKTYTYKPYSNEIKKEDVDNYVKELANYYAASGEFLYIEQADRMGTEVKKDDVLDIDFAGYLDGEAFDGGTGSTKLKIGSGKFIPGFEDALIGKKVGEKVDIDVTFPEKYGNAELAGKPAVFTVTIKGCGTDEKLTEENLYKYLDFKSAEELNADIEKYLTENPQSSEEDYMYSCKEEYLKGIIEKSEYADLAADIDSYYNIIYGIMEETAKSYGMEVETIVQQGYGYESLDAYKKATKENAERQIKQQQILNKIGIEEGISLADKEYKAYATNLVAEVSQDDLTTFTKTYNEKYGEGSFELYVEQMYILDKVFEKYAKVSE